MPAASFKVVGTRPTSQLTPGGRFSDVYEITFQLASGTIGHVMIPRDRIADTDYVREQVQTHADALAAIEAL